MKRWAYRFGIDRGEKLQWKYAVVRCNNEETSLFWRSSRDIFVDEVYSLRVGLADRRYGPFGWQNGKAEMMIESVFLQVCVAKTVKGG